MPIPRHPRRARRSAVRQAARRPRVPRAPPTRTEADRRLSPVPSDLRGSRALPDRFRERALQDPPGHAARVEVLFSERTRRAALPLVVGLNARERTRGFVHGPEAEDTLPVEQEATGARVLHDRGLSAGQVAGGAVADPTSHELDVHRLRVAELASGTLDVRAVLLGRRAHFPGFTEPPAERGQARAPLLISA